MVIPLPIENSEEPLFHALSDAESLSSEIEGTIKSI